MGLKVRDKVIYTNMQHGSEEVGEIQLIAEVTECITTGIVGKSVYYVRTTTGGELFFRQNLKKHKDEVKEQCPCMKEPSYNCGMKCSRCGREL